MPASNTSEDPDPSTITSATESTTGTYQDELPGQLTHPILCEELTGCGWLQERM